MEQRKGVEGVKGEGGGVNGDEGIIPVHKEFSRFFHKWRASRVTFG